MDQQPPAGEPVFPAVPSKARRGVSSGTVTLLFVLAAGGAATRPDGLLIGVPSAGSLLLGVLLGVLVWFSRSIGFGGFALPLAAFLAAALLGPPVESLLLFSGPPLFIFVLAAVVLMVATSGRRPAKFWLLPAFFAIYAGVSFEAQTRVGPEGDEPQYLMVAESLIRDHDLALDQDFTEKRYEAFVSRPLEPHFRIRGSEGQIYSLHAVGLSVLILPAYALFGYAGASFFMAFLGALLVREVRRLVKDMTGEDNLAEGTAWLVGLSPPLIHFAGLIFTEIPAALLLAIGLRAGVFGRMPRALMTAALCASALPWLNVRYAILSAAMVGVLGWRWWQGRVPEREGPGKTSEWLAPILVLTGSAAAILLYHFKLWGFFDPRRVYGRSREFSLDILPEGLPGLFLDQEFGLLVYAPIFVLCLSGWVFLWRRHRVLACATLFAAAGVIATASVWPMWRGGFNPPARFLVPLVPVLAATLALALRRGVGPGTALLAGWGLWCGLFGAMNMDTIHRDRDGVAPFFRTQSGAREWTAALPSFVLSEDRPTRFLAWPWAMLLVLPVLARGAGKGSWARSSSNRETFVVTFVFMAFAVFADRASPRVRAPERDASRLLGSPAFSLPALVYEPSSTARWPLEFFYEPHRYPEGRLFAQGVMLRAGRYQVSLATHDRLTPEPMPYVECRGPRGGVLSRVPMMTAPGELQAALEIAVDGACDLRLIGGQPASFTEVLLVRIR